MGFSFIERPRKIYSISIFVQIDKKSLNKNNKVDLSIKLIEFYLLEQAEFGNWLACGIITK